MHLFSKASVRAVTAIVFVSIGIVSAQFSTGTPANARLDALANEHISDISGIYRYPVLMTGYLNHIQATWNGGGAGGFIGIKSVSDMFSFGVLANQGPMAPEFTGAAIGALDTYLTTAPPAGNKFDNSSFVIPHLLLGFDLGAAAICADLFLEYGGYGGEVDDTTKYSGSLSNPGFRVSGKFGVSEAEIMAKFGLGFPSISGERPRTAAPPKLTSNDGLYMEAGAEANMPLGGADWVLGLCYTKADYRFKYNDTTYINNLMTNSRLNAYLGMEFNFVETAVAALGYSFDRRALINSQPNLNGKPSSTEINYYHRLYAGVENAWEKAWLFDSFQLRGGALYTISSRSGDTDAPSPAQKPNYSMPAGHSTVQPRIGVGVSRAFATIDVSLNPGSWNGLFTGPEVAFVTATVKF
ncbi:MAG: hypothetical protein LBB74_08060 [Chitinispirillales bacterium]|jgi:hypothetical protein|nr:hypothetical protein [Chitinispirillales bacterium]